MSDVTRKNDCIHWKDSNGRQMMTVLFEDIPPIDMPVEEDDQLEFTIDGKPF